MTLNAAQKQALLADRLNEFEAVLPTIGNQNNDQLNQIIAQSVSAIKDDPDNTALLYETINRLDKLVGELDAKQDHFYIVFVSQLILDLVGRFLQLSDHPELISTLARYIALLANKTGDVNEIQNLFARTQEMIHILQTMDISESLESHLSDTLNTLYFNYGIIATRTHKLNHMRTAYDFLVSKHPHLALQFFDEAMKQSQIVDYPAPVKELIKEYYEQTRQDMS